METSFGRGLVGMGPARFYGGEVLGDPATPIKPRHEVVGVPKTLENGLHVWICFDVPRVLLVSFFDDSVFCINGFVYPVIKKFGRRLDLLFR
jgi:hypothetical protein